MLEQGIMIDNPIAPRQPFVLRRRQCQGWLNRRPRLRLEDGSITAGHTGAFQRALNHTIMHQPKKKYTYFFLGSRNSVY